jgi:hypothetical protein
MGPTQRRPNILSAPVLATCAAVLVGSVLASGLQGCRSLENETATTSERARGDEDPTRLRGCWKLNLQARGVQRDSLRDWLPAGSLPSIVELDTTRAGPSGQDGVYEAYSWSDSRRSSRPFSVWRPLGPDSIRVQRAGALAGTMLQLRVAEERLVGEVVVYGDAGMGGTPERREGALEATPARCPRR